MATVSTKSLQSAAARNEQTARSPLSSDAPRWWQRPFWVSLWPALASGMLLWLALPPVNLTLLAWIAPVGWLWLVARVAPPGRGGYWAIWLATSLHWLAVLEGIRRPYWALHFGWAALSLYLAVFVVLFVASSRILVHRWRVPLWLAAPTSWVGWELARGHIITGFSGALLGHTQVRWTRLIQIADLFGAYGVSFVVMVIAACVTLVLLRRTWRTAGLAVALAAALLGGTLAYGHARWRVAPASTQAPVRVALLQGTYDTLFEFNRERTQNMFRQYLKLVRRAADEHPDLDLIIWPESTFTEFNPLVVVPKDGISDDVPSPIPANYLPRVLANFKEKRTWISETINSDEDAAHRNIQQLVGVSTLDLTRSPPANYNSCLWLDAQGEIQGRYDKNHLVMFGEYIPVLDWFPQLYQYTPMASGTARGQGARSFEVAGLRFAPTICFETVVPHLVRRHLRQLEREGTPADVLVNITHDGWFWGSAILDLQQACSVFRAVENRRPMLVAANPGLTTWIDGNGRIMRELPRHDEDYLVADVVPDGRDSLYRRLGDWPAGICLAVASFGLLSGWRVRRKSA